MHARRFEHRRGDVHASDTLRTARKGKKQASRAATVFEDRERREVRRQVVEHPPVEIGDVLLTGVEELSLRGGIEVLSEEPGIREDREVRLFCRERVPRIRHQELNASRASRSLSYTANIGRRFVSRSVLATRSCGLSRRRDASLRWASR